MPERNERDPAVLAIAPRTFVLLLAGFCGGFIVFLSAVHYLTTSIEPQDFGAAPNAAIAPSSGTAVSPPPTASATAPPVLARSAAGPTARPVKSPSPCPPVPSPAPKRVERTPPTSAARSARRTNPTPAQRPMPAMERSVPAVVPTRPLVPRAMPARAAARPAKTAPAHASALPAKPAHAAALRATPVPLIVPPQDSASLTPAHALDPRNSLLVPVTSAATPPDNTLAPKPR